MFGRNLRSSKRGAAGGPSGMTTEHLRPLLSDGRGMRLLFHLGENLARGHVPEMAVSMVRAGRMTDSVEKTRRRCARHCCRGRGEEVGRTDDGPAVGFRNKGSDSTSPSMRCQPGQVASAWRMFCKG